MVTGSGVGQGQDRSRRPRGTELPRVAGAPQPPRGAGLCTLSRHGGVRVLLERDAKGVRGSEKRCGRPEGPPRWLAVGGTTALLLAVAVGIQCRRLPGSDGAVGEGRGALPLTSQGLFCFSGRKLYSYRKQSHFFFVLLH